MTATFTVEDGTGLAAANAYVSVADADQYHLDEGDPGVWAGSKPVQKQAAIRQATRFLDARYGGRWRGARANETQALDWPRADVYDDDDFLVDDDAIPAEIEAATAVVALKVLSGDDLLADVDASANVLEETNKVGDLSQSVKYAGTRSAQKRYPLVDGILRALLRGSAEAVRA